MLRLLDGTMKIEAFWQQRTLLNYLLYPLSLVFSGLAALRRYGYTVGLLSVWQAPVPVVIVGNLTAGGSGKTPVTIALVQALAKRGLHPGVISRGYGGDTLGNPLLVDAAFIDQRLADRQPPDQQPPDQQPPDRCQTGAQQDFPGDEPLLIHVETGAPVAVFPDRKRAIAHLLQHSPEVNVIVSDDGLQHYALARTLELVVIDPDVGFGNGMRLPAGPLRESPGRLSSVDFILVRDTNADTPDSASTEKLAIPGYVQQTRNAPVIRYQQTVADCVPVSAQDGRPSPPMALSSWSGLTVHAVTGIANPHRFFDTLHRAGIKTIQHVFADHYRFSEDDFAFLGADQLPVIMTTKDAVKVKALDVSEANRLWVLPLKTCFPDTLIDQLMAGLDPE